MNDVQEYRIGDKIVDDKHIYETQQDILMLIKDLNYKSPEWPKCYWPPKNKKATYDELQNTIQYFINNRNEIREMVESNDTNLFSNPFRMDEENKFREIILTSDHTDYHIGGDCDFKTST